MRTATTNPATDTVVATEAAPSPFKNTGMFTAVTLTLGTSRPLFMTAVDATAIIIGDGGHGNQSRPLRGRVQSSTTGEAAQNFQYRRDRLNNHYGRDGITANYAEAAIQDFAVAGKQMQLANPICLPSRQVFFQPNTLVCPKFGTENNIRNPLVTYVVWEVYDPLFLNKASRMYAEGIHNSRTDAGDYHESGERVVNELEYILSRRNLKKGQVLGAWLPSETMYTALTALDRMNLANQAVGGAVAYGEAALLNQGDRPIYSHDESHLPAGHAIRTTYTNVEYNQATRAAAWNSNNATAGHTTRTQLLQEIGYMLNKFTPENICLFANGNAAVVATTMLQFLALRNGGGNNGVANQLRWVIPRGTRIRLKTFRHIGIKAGPQLLALPDYDGGGADYVPPQALANGVDFDWGERRGRFPYQRICPRGDNYPDQPSKQGGRGFQYEDAVKNIQLSWRQQPELVCEWIILPKGKVQPQYRLAYPQFEFFRALYPSPTFTLPDRGEPIEVSIRGLKLNEVPNQVYVYAMITEDSRNYLEWLDVKPTITSLETQINETVDTTSHIPLWLGYRFFKECCPFSTKTLDEWTQDNMWCLSPSQLNISPETWTESMARVSTLSIKATVKMNRAYRQIESNYSPALFPGLAETGRSVMKPKFELRVVIVYNNHSLIINSRNEMLIEKNTLSTRGPTGLVRQDRGLPKQGGLPFY